MITDVFCGCLHIHFMSFHVLSRGSNQPGPFTSSGSFVAMDTEVVLICMFVSHVCSAGTRIYDDVICFLLRELRLSEKSAFQQPLLTVLSDWVSFFLYHVLLLSDICMLMCFSRVVYCNMWLMVHTNICTYGSQVDGAQKWSNDNCNETSIYCMSAIWIKFLFQSHGFFW